MHVELWPLDRVRPYEKNPRLNDQAVDAVAASIWGIFILPKAYTGEWRVDTHPRLSRDGRFVCIDAVKEGEGRQLCLFDMSTLIGLE